MNTFFMVMTLAFVVGTLAFVAFALFEVSPFARHADQFRNPRTGKRRWESPFVD
jgi:hypothetical protein